MPSTEREGACTHHAVLLGEISGSSVRFPDKRPVLRIGGATADRFGGTHEGGQQQKQPDANLGEMIEIATHRRWEPTKHTGSKDAKFGMYRYDTRFGFPVKDHKGNAVRANIYTAALLIRNASDGKK